MTFTDILAITQQTCIAIHLSPWFCRIQQQTFNKTLKSGGQQTNWRYLLIPETGGNFIIFRFTTMSCTGCNEVVVILVLNWSRNENANKMLWAPRPFWQNSSISNGKTTTSVNVKNLFTKLIYIHLKKTQLPHFQDYKALHFKWRNPYFSV